MKAAEANINLEYFIPVSLYDLMDLQMSRVPAKFVSHSRPEGCQVLSCFPAFSVANQAYRW
jgi:hypothetical protein